MNASGVPVDKIHYWPRIIALSGKYGTGKDSAADAVLRHIHHTGFKAEHLKFADALKRASAIMTGTAEDDQYSVAGKCKQVNGLGDMTVARFQQVLGTVARVHIHPDIWVVPVIARCKAEPDTCFVISDCRFPNEVSTIHAAGGVVIRLNRRADLISAASTAGRDPTHVSETALDEYGAFDLVVDNNGNQHEHISQVLQFINKKW